MSRACCYVLAPASAGKAASYCGKPTRYLMVEDGGEPGAAKVRKHDMVEDGGEPGAAKVRKHDPFCPEHRAVVDALPQDEDDKCVDCGSDSYNCRCLKRHIP